MDAEFAKLSRKRRIPLRGISSVENIQFKGPGYQMAKSPSDIAKIKDAYSK